MLSYEIMLWAELWSKLVLSYDDVSVYHAIIL